MADEESQQAQRSEVDQTHRLPTLSAAEALKKARDHNSRAIPTGLVQLDLQLAPRGLPDANRGRGLPLGQVTEVYGPPGSGKTSFGLQLCASALKQGGQAVWIDTASPLAQERMDTVMADSSRSGDSPHSAVRPSRTLQRFTAPTLPHLLALLLRGVPASLGDSVRIIVVDTISAPFESAYARDHRSANASEASKWASNRKFSIMGDLVRELGKLAVMLDAAIVLLCQCATKLRSGAPAILLPSISGHDWEAGIATRILLYRDWSPPQQRQMLGNNDIQSCHYATVCKSEGSQVDDAVTTAVAFTVSRAGVSELPNKEGPHVSAVPCSPARPKKRNYVEIADSDAEDLTSDDDYGWMEEDEIAAEIIPADGGRADE